MEKTSVSIYCLTAESRQIQMAPAMRPHDSIYRCIKNIFISIYIIFFIIHAAYGFDESSLPTEQLSGPLKTNSNLPTNVKPKILQGVTIKEKLGNNIDLSLNFIDENGHTKNFTQILNGKPTILTLNYYRCTTLCSIQLVNLAKSVANMGWNIGKEYNMVTVSFDPTDTPLDSKKTRQEYLSIANQPQGSWNFYTGSLENINKLTEQIGYYFKYDPISKEYAHAAAIFFISPNGNISRYLYGINYPPNQIKFSLIDASENKIGSPSDKFLLTCFHYNPTSGKYDLFAKNLLKIAAFATIVIFAFFLIYFMRRDKKKA